LGQKSTDTVEISTWLGRVCGLAGREMSNTHEKSGLANWAIILGQFDGAIPLGRFFLLGEFQAGLLAKQIGCREANYRVCGFFT
jgi:hypothetical protein